MLGIYLAVVVVVGASAVVGQAVWLACAGRLRRPGAASFAAPAVGFGALLALAALTVRLPGRAATSAAFCGAAALLGAAYLVRARVEVRGGLAWGLPVALAVVALVSLPFAVSGRVGVLGVGDNNDMNVHLLGAWFLQHGIGPDRSLLIGAGYPLGPHAIAASISTAFGTSLETAFTGVALAVPVLAALAALGVLARRGANVAGWLGRMAAAVLVGLCYLASAYLAEGAFKETIEGMLVLAFVVGLRDVVAQGSVGPARAVPLGLLVAGSLYTYSYNGVVWPAVVLAVWLGLELARERPRSLLAAAGRRLRGAAAPLLAGVATVAIAVAAEIPRMATFGGSIFNQERPHVLGNVLHPIPPLEVLGVWFQSDFRFDPPFSIKLAVLLAIVAVVAVVSLVWWLRRRDLTVPAGAIGVALVYAEVDLLRNPYAAAKALAIAAPLVTLMLVAGVVEGWRLGDARRRLGRLPRRPVAVVARAAAVLGLLAAAYSSYTVLRDAPVGPQTQARELARVRALVGPSAPTLFLGNDDNVNWELRGANLSKPPLLYPIPFVPLSQTKLWLPGLAFDIDSVTPQTLDRFRYVILPRSGFASRVPANWRPVLHAGSYVVYRRSGPTPARTTLDERGAPGAPLDCSTQNTDSVALPFADLTLPGVRLRHPGAGQAISRRRGVAGVLPAPVRGSRRAWHGTIGLAGKTASQTLDLPAGNWDVSLQYASREPVTVTGPGLTATLPATLDRIGPYWLAGRVHVGRSGPVTISVIPHRLGSVGRLLRARGRTLAYNSLRHQPLGAIAATRHGARERTLPLGRACGRYVDWYRTAPSGS